MTQTYPIQVEVVRGGMEQLDALAPEWRALCDINAKSEPFVRPEFIRAYLKAFEPEASLVIFTASCRGELLALLPMIEEKVRFAGLPARTLRGAAGTHSARFDLVCAHGEAGQKAIAAIWEELKQQHDWDMIELPLIAEPAEARTLVAMAAESGFPSGWWDAHPGPYVQINGENPDLEPWLQATSANFRQRVRRLRRKAQTEGVLELKSFSLPNDGVLEKFYALESSGWKGKHGTAIVCDPNTRQFYDEVARVAGEQGYFRCYFLTLEDRVLAGFLGLSDGKRFFMLKPAYNEEFSHYSPGHLLAASVIKDCAEHGFQEFDFMPPALRWKTDWSSQVRPSGYGYIFRKGFYGEMLWGMKFRLRPWAKQVVNSIRKKAS
ncbi:MAG TPA: GNAT family N-acetyltransferase [Candidatus Limnocylindrales bacterium]|nr:GNAT family N-acetyltransferase [Candidatus Limnocylindrales bacterium]